MNLLFNGQKLDNGDIDRIIERHKPKTKNKIVSFRFTNLQPFRVMTENGWKQIYGGEKQFKTTCTTTITTKEKGEQTGVLQYYQTENGIERKGVVSYDRRPHFVTFVGGVIGFDYSKDKALFAYLLSHPECTLNSDRTNVVPTFEYLEPLSASRGEAEKYSLKIQAYNILATLKDKNQPMLKAIYELGGGQEFDELRKLGEWDVIMAFVYRLADTDASKIIEQSKDLSLTIASKVHQALEEGVITYGDATYFWGGDTPKKIVQVPTGYTDNHIEWFAGWIKSADKGAVSKELNSRLEDLMFSKRMEGK